MITIGTSGFIIFIMYIVVFFLGYSIPGNALAVNDFYVGCNLLGAVSLIGKGLVYWVLSGDFFSTQSHLKILNLHVVLSFLIASLVLLHMNLIHVNVSSDSFFLKSSLKAIFIDIAMYKDISLLLCIIIACVYPFAFGWDFLFHQEAFIAPKTPVEAVLPELYLLYLYGFIKAISAKKLGILWLTLNLILNVALLVWIYIIKMSFDIKRGYSNLFFLFSLYVLSALVSSYIVVAFPLYELTAMVQVTLGVV